MARLSWHKPEDILYEAGVDHCVFYPPGQLGVPWNGVIGISQKQSVDTSKLYVDGVNVRSRGSTMGYEATLECFTYPNEFLGYDGFDEKPKTFNLSYRTKIGDQNDGLDHGYKIHLIYNATAKLPEMSYSSLGDSVDAATFSWELTTRSMLVRGAKASSHLIIDSTKTYSWTMEILEDMLYGSIDQPSTFPTVDEVLTIFDDTALLKITDHGDGTWTAEGPDSAIDMLDPTTFAITWPSAVYIDFESYHISSL